MDISIHDLDIYDVIQIQNLANWKNWYKHWKKLPQVDKDWLTAHKWTMSDAELNAWYDAHNFWEDI